MTWVAIFRQLDGRWRIVAHNTQHEMQGYIQGCIECLVDQGAERAIAQARYRIRPANEEELEAIREWRKEVDEHGAALVPWAKKDWFVDPEDLIF
jgi:hypothetical protein